ncbi:MAG: hypothetical protein ACJ8BW_00030 [Ktedonobacteraceae bacterium]
MPRSIDAPAGTTGEAHLIAPSYGLNPEGEALELATTAEKLVQLEEVDHVNYETVQRTQKFELFTLSRHFL